ncbi:MAG: sodium-dependent transporter [Thermodesulfobacteriota bacterium]|nr:sodium-dependent transporter [Thermodesulfobacteriota bacterium]
MHKNISVMKEGWGSRIGIILAVAGSAVGLGNFLRFPGKAAAYGGGTFMIPYLISLIILGIPICWVEWTLGRYGGVKGYNSSPGIFSVIWKHKAAKYFGAIGLLIPIIIYMYYAYIESWCLAYFYYYFTGALDLGKDASLYGSFFENFVGIQKDGTVFTGGINDAAVFWAIAFFINFFLIYRGLSRGIEAFCKIAMPLLIICAVIILIRVLTLGTPNINYPEQNVLNGLGFMWNPKLAEGESFLSSLSNPTMWLEAAGQIFFSLSVGFGIVLTYASYLRKNDDIVLNSLTASSTNEFCEVCLGGLITIPAAFIFLGAAPIEKVAGSTLGLGFYTMPVVFAYMPFGDFFGGVWFLMLFLAAITSSISMLQPVIAFFEEGFNLNRTASITFLGLLTGTGSLIVIYFSKDLIALETMDFWVGTAMIFILATFQVILFGWIFGVDRGLAEAENGAELRIPRFFPFIIKYVSPAYLILIFIFWVKQYVPGYISALKENGVALLTIIFMISIFIFLIILVKIASSNWTGEKRGLN